MASVEPIRRRSSRVPRGLAAVPVLLALALLVPAAAVAAEPTSGYNPTTTTTESLKPETPKPEQPKSEPKPQAETGPQEAPKPEIEPSKEATRPERETAKPEIEPSKETAKPEIEPEEPPKPRAGQDPAKASALPFTGLDLRWDVGLGVLLVGAGVSIVAAQRRHRRERRR